MFTKLMNDLEAIQEDVIAKIKEVKEAENKIIVLQDGVITDMGSSKELLKYDNWYKLQYLKQLKGDVYE